jgi:hypothetical protein
VADAREPSNKGAWSDLEQGFFAGAPSDASMKTPPPIRFDDLEPIPTPRVERRMRQRRAADLAVAERVELRPVLVRVGVRCVPALRKTRAAFANASQLVRREARRIVARVVAAIPTGPADRWAVASLAALFLLVGVSAVVAASRGGASTLPPAKTLSANVRMNAHGNAKLAIAHVAPRASAEPAAAVAPERTPGPAAAPAAATPPSRASTAPSRAAESRPVVSKLKRQRPHRRVALAGKVPAGKAPAGKARAGKVAVAHAPPAPAPKKAIASAAPVRPTPARPVAVPARPAPPAPTRAAASRPLFSR